MKLECLNMDTSITHYLGIVYKDLHIDVERVVKLVNFEKASTKRMLFHSVMQNCIE